MVFECDLTGKIIYISQRAIDFTGFTNEELEGRNMLDFLVPEDRKRAIENMKRSFAGENIGSSEYALFRKDGTTYPTLVRTSRIIYEKKVTGLRGLVIEITERKKTEKALQESEIHYRLLAEREHMTNEKLNVIGKLTRHDVRNKLSVVKANVYLLKKRVGGNPEAANCIAAIEQSVEQTESLLEFSRIYEQIGTEQLKTVDVEECFNEAASFFPDLQKMKVTNECHGFSVTADSLLRQLFYNFIDNSLKHGEKISEIQLHYMKEGNEAKLFYEDDGVGISSANKPRTFSEGFTTGNGTGHGLYLAKRMMEVYGWKIEEAGEEGKGVKFVMTIPETKFS
jgi:PAS domain S-box-containing protein